MIQAKEIAPIEDFVLGGFQKRFSQVFFKCPVAWVQENTESLAVKTLFGNNPPSYPYATLWLQSYAIGGDSALNASSMGRFGIEVNPNHSGKLGQKVRVIPTDFTVRCRYKCASLNDAKSFASHWLFALRFGHLKFNVVYASQTFQINVVGDNQIDFPEPEAATSATREYVIETTVTINGYVSKPIIGTQALVHDVRVGVGVQGQAGTLIHKDVWEFPARRQQKCK